MEKMKNANPAIILGIFFKSKNKIISYTCNNKTSADCLTCLLTDGRAKHDLTGKCLCTIGFYDGGEA